MNTKIDRSWIPSLSELIRQNRQIVLLSGPRQVGKTTLARQLLTVFDSDNNYLNWDDINHRELILKGPDAIILHLGLDRLFAEKPLIVFDEIHKYSQWKNFLKGFFDRYEEAFHFLVTGSARLDLYRKGGDSLMGRYFHYRLHPLSIRELHGTINPQQILQNTIATEPALEEQLLQKGGFPEPFLQNNPRFSNRWQRLRGEQLIQEDIRDATHIQEIQQLQLLVKLLTKQAGKETKYSTLARSIRVSVDTIRRWLDILESFYFCYRVRPWYNNISTALRKEPRTYLWDWSLIEDAGQRAENFVASHLLKAVQWWSDLGYGNYELHYLRTKDGKEVDFLISRDSEPWFLVEVKQSEKAALSPHLEWFQKKTGAEHAFQVFIQGESVEADCFSVKRPIKVSASTLLRQLV